MASISDFRSGMAIRHNGEIWIVIDFQHIKPGKGQVFFRTKLKNLKTSRVVDNTFRPSDVIDEVRLEEREMQYLYDAGEELTFMDRKTFEQISLHRNMVGDQVKFLKEGNLVKILFLEEEPVTVSLPMFIELKVTYAPPGVKGDTVSNLQKPVTLETGAEIQVPLFVKEGNVIKIDTRTSRYIERTTS